MGRRNKRIIIGSFVSISREHVLSKLKARLSVIPFNWPYFGKRPFGRAVRRLKLNVQRDFLLKYDVNVKNWRVYQNWYIYQISEIRSLCTIRSALPSEFQYSSMGRASHRNSEGCGMRFLVADVTDRISTFSKIQLIKRESRLYFLKSRFQLWQDMFLGGRNKWLNNNYFISFSHGTHEYSESKLKARL